jgi:hypothetical protein
MPVPGELASDRQFPGEGIKTAHGQSRRFSPAQAEHNADPHHRGLVRAELVGERLEGLRSKDGPFDETDLRKTDIAAR